MDLSSIRTPWQAVAPYFQHSPLDLHKKQIRLFTIEAGLVPCTSLRDQAPRHLLACLLEHTDLIIAETDDPDSTYIVPDYIAVSYTWGNEDGLHDIMVNGSIFKVRSNLHEFLREMHGRGDKFETTFWVDQLCIDQINGTERNHQVSMMSSIYEYADTVYAWIGTATSRTYAAKNMLKQLEDSFVEFDDQLRATDDRKVGIEKWKAFKESVLSMVDWTILADILGRSYWSRLWIAQEVMLAQQVVVVCGPVEWTPLSDDDIIDPTATSLFETLQDKMSADNLQNDNIDNALQLLLDREFGFVKKLELGLILMNHSHRKCSDPRDKIYGLQACAEPSQRIPVDYSWSAEDLFFAVAERCEDEPFGLYEILEMLRDEMGLHWWSDDDIDSLIEDPQFRVNRRLEG